MRASWAVIIAFAVAPIYSQNTPSRVSLASADAVVVGTLHRDFKFPWFDGWNERGHIEVERVLKGVIKPGTPLSFAWERDFRPGWCLTRPDWRGAVGKRGIWVLHRNGIQYRAHDPFTGFLESGEISRHEVLHPLASRN
jgi:hypothetical protein